MKSVYLLAVLSKAVSVIKHKQFYQYWWIHIMTTFLFTNLVLKGHDVTQRAIFGKTKEVCFDCGAYQDVATSQCPSWTSGQKRVSVSCDVSRSCNHLLEMGLKILRRRKILIHVFFLYFQDTLPLSSTKITLHFLRKCWRASSAVGRTNYRR